MDLDFLVNRLTNTIHKNRPAQPEPVVFVSSDDNTEKVIPNRSPRWQKSTKRIVIVGLVILSLLCIFLMRNMITPLIFSCLLVFYLKPLVISIQKKFNISYKWAVIIVFGIFLILMIGIIAFSGFSIYGQILNFLDLLNNSMDSLSDKLVDQLGGADSSLGKIILRYFDGIQDLQINQQVQNLIQRIGGSVLAFVQNFSSKLGWLFFTYGFSFFIVWESKPNVHKPDLINIPGYEYDIEMGRYHLSLIWRKFLWGQAMMMLLTFAIYIVLFVLFRVRYAFILACAAALTQLIPYVGSFLAWGALALVTLFQGNTILGMQPIPYTILVVVLAFLIDKFKDGFIQPKFLADTLKVHPAAVLAAALICARTMGFLGIFLAAPLVATLKLIFRYILQKLKDADPWENIVMVDDPIPFKEYLTRQKNKCVEIYDKLIYYIHNSKSRLSGGKGHGSNGL